MTVEYTTAISVSDISSVSIRRRRGAETLFRLESDGTPPDPGNDERHPDPERWLEAFLEKAASCPCGLTLWPDRKTKKHAGREFLQALVDARRTFLDADGVRLRVACGDSA